MKRPLVNAEPVSEFGETDASAVVDYRNLDFTEDMMYVPGFSDLLQRRETEIREYKEGSRLGQDVSHLPVNIHWTRRTSVGGISDTRAQMAKKNVGYRPVTATDLGKPWLLKMGMGWQTLPDGTITNAAGDLQLMVLEGSAAANRAAWKKNQWVSASQQVELADKQKGEPAGQEIQGPTTKDGKRTSIVDWAKAKMDGGSK